jgi:2-oxoglutarate ferredoxin oxidoreductase subunit alpha
MTVAHTHLRYLNPFPLNLGELLTRYRRVLVAELNGGQLALLLRAHYLVDARVLTKLKGQPFTISEVEAGIRGTLVPRLRRLRDPGSGADDDAQDWRAP